MATATTITANDQGHFPRGRYGTGHCIVRGEQGEPGLNFSSVASHQGVHWPTSQRPGASVSPSRKGGDKIFLVSYCQI